jgi:hypothetical protein
MSPRYRIGVDIGGSFSGFIPLDAARARPGFEAYHIVSPVRRESAPMVRRQRCAVVLGFEYA